jgi:hypothetical protein
VLALALNALSSGSGFGLKGLGSFELRVHGLHVAEVLSGKKITGNIKEGKVR